MTTLTTTTASVFVTTYGVGNEQGFATGKWFDLTDYSDKDEFIEAATEYAQDVLGDHDPELCFADYESSFADLDLISECHVDSQVWDLFDMDSSDLDMVIAYTSNVGVNGSFEDMLSEAQDCYQGQYDSDADFAQETLQDCGYLEDLPSFIECHIDWDGVARDLMMDYFEVNGHYFRNC